MKMEKKCSSVIDLTKGLFKGVLINDHSKEIHHYYGCKQNLSLPATFITFKYSFSSPFLLLFFYLAISSLLDWDYLLK